MNKTIIIPHNTSILRYYDCDIFHKWLKNNEKYSYRFKKNHFIILIVGETGEEIPLRYRSGPNRTIMHERANKIIAEFWQYMLDEKKAVRPKRGITNRSDSGRIIKTQYREYLKSEEWKLKSFKCITDADQKCEVCEERENLNTHHYNYRFLYNERPEDLFCLCQRCHMIYHSKIKILPNDINLRRFERLNHIIKICRR